MAKIKKRLLISCAILFMVLTIIVTIYIIDDHIKWSDPDVTHGFNKGDVFQLKKDLFLYCYMEDHYTILDPVGFDFSIEEFKEDPSVGVVDAEYKIYVSKIIPKGTKVIFTDIERSYHWNGGNFDYLQRGKFLDKAIFSKQVGIHRIIGDNELLVPVRKDETIPES